MSKLKPDDQFTIGNVKCTITQTGTFSGELHYGFTFVADGRPGESARYGCGWMPVHFVDNFTRYHDHEKQVETRAA